MQLITDDPDAARCPGCRVRSTSGKDWVLTRPHDLPSGGGPVAVQWRKRQWRCRTEVCPRASFTEQVAQVPAGMRTTTRLRTPHWRWRWRTGGTSPRSPRGTGCRGRRCSERWRSMARSSWPSRSRWRRPDPWERPGSSTSPVTRPCWGRSTGGAAPRSRPGWPPARPSSGPGWRWW
ncbi:transposase family protein [Pseudonocardia sp.]|uniref:transposase family protein n=1 Tax=Pseudonocardia sp. TaxID=60912 RepID=UPI0034518405